MTQYTNIPNYLLNMNQPVIPLFALRLAGKFAFARKLVKISLANSLEEHKNAPDGGTSGSTFARNMSQAPILTDRAMQGLSLVTFLDKQESNILSGIPEVFFWARKRMNMPWAFPKHTWANKKMNASRTPAQILEIIWQSQTLLCRGN